jgi:hypothetical protein
LIAARPECGSFFRTMLRANAEGLQQIRDICKKKISALGRTTSHVASGGGFRGKS